MTCEIQIPQHCL